MAFCLHCPMERPHAFATFKVAPALAAENTVVLTSSEKAPLTVRHHRNSWRLLFTKSHSPPSHIIAKAGFLSRARVVDTNK
ncbi:hypothetical protein BDW66DRAFT_138099 [Aspergillus desertorum]